MFLLLLFIFILITFISFTEESDTPWKMIFFFIIGFLLIMVAGLRPDDIDNDYENYEYMYYTSYNLTTEISFIWISSLVKVLFDNVLMLFFVYALLGVSLKIFAIKQMTQLWFLSLLIYLSSYFMLHEMMQIRAGVAAGIFLLAIKPLSEGKKRKFLTLILIAIMFHYSALLLLLLCFLGNKGFTRKTIWIYGLLIPVSYIIYFLHINLILVIPIPYVQDKIEIYQATMEMGEYDEINVFNAVLLVKIIVFYVLLWKNKLISEKNIYVPILLKIEAISLASFIAFNQLPVVSFRINELFGIVEIVLIPLLFYIIKPSYVSRVIVIIFALCLFLINIFYTGMIIV